VTGELARFALLARAVAGRPMAVVQGGDEASYTDGASIFLMDAPLPLLEASLMVQAGLVGAGSLDPWVMARLRGRRDVTSRYLAFEVARCAEVMAGVLPLRVTELLAPMTGGPVPSSPRESLAWAGQPRRAAPALPAWAGTIRPAKAGRAGAAPATGVPAGQDPPDSPAREALPEHDDTDDTERSRILELFASPLRNPFSSMIQKLFGLGRAPGTRGGGSGELSIAGGRGERPGGDATVLPSPIRSTPAAPGRPGGHRYPEWDYRRGAYRPGWCAAAEFDPPAPAPEAARPSAVDRPLRRQLAGLGFTDARHRRQPEGDVLDVPGLVDLVARRAAGSYDDVRVYETRRRTGRDLGVLVLLDSTGSSGDAHAGGRVFDAHRLVAARLTAALDELGDRVGAFGFFSDGREAVRFLRVKDFDDRYDHAARERMAALAPRGFTRLGAVIRHATGLIERRAGTSRRLLVLVGDGLPYEEGYEQRYASEDTARALDEAVARGVGCIRVTMDVGVEDEVVRHAWARVPHRRLSDPGDLARHARPLISEALRAAQASRRPVGSASAAC
jgi:nitric oxide reductase NorD protein